MSQSNQRHAWTFLAIIVATSSMGCGSFGAATDSAELSQQSAVSMAPDPIRIVYRTKADRLNLAGANLPPCSMATLQIQVPHPYYKASVGRARVSATPATSDADLMPDDLEEVLGHASATWEGDIPLWQIETVVAQLDQANFFRRARVLQPEAFLSVHAKAGRLGRPYRGVPELDAMIVSISSTETSSKPLPQRPELARLPIVSVR